MLDLVFIIYCEFYTDMLKGSKFRNLAVLLLALLVGMSHSEAKEMTSYEWSDLEKSEERAFATGLLEGFAYSGYSRIDRKNPSQIAVWNNLADCLQSSTDKIFLVLHNAVALGDAIDRTFAEVLWNRAVPVICKRDDSPAARQQVVQSIQIASHMDWHRFSKNQKSLYIRGNLEALLFLAEIAGDKNDADLLKKLLTSASIEKYLKLFAEQGIDYRYPIPWSITRANGAFTGLGSPYPAFSSKKIVDKNIGAELVELWGRYVDFESVSQICSRSWESQKSTIRFHPALHEQSMKSNACIAKEIKERLVPAYFNDQGVKVEEVKKLQRSMSAQDWLPEKIRMAKGHFDSLKGEEAQEFCRREWVAVTAPSKSLRYRTSALTYLLTLSGVSDQTLQIADEMDRSCGLSISSNTP
jgi:hypothetical protein